MLFVRVTGVTYAVFLIATRNCPYDQYDLRISHENLGRF